ncbi:MAG: transglutaminase-like domain-containing protein [Bacteroidales bacterium]
MKNSDQHKELSALISLLDDPNETLFGKIRERLVIYGPQAIPLLENAWDNSFDNTLQVRIEDVIHSIQFNHLIDELNEWNNNNQYDLIKGFFLVSKFQYPDLDEKKIRDQLELIKRDIWLELNSSLTALEKVKVMNHIIFDIFGFSGNKTNIDSPPNFFLNTILESKKGNHLSLGILYVIIAQKLGIPIFGVDLPQHFILSYVDEIHDEKYTIADENEVLFYINPFNRGAVFTKKEIDVFVKHMKIKPKQSFYKPCSNQQIIIRLMDGLLFSFSKLGHTDKVDELTILINIFKK